MRSFTPLNNIKYPFWCYYFSTFKKKFYCIYRSQENGRILDIIFLCIQVILQNDPIYRKIEDQLL